MKPHYMFLLLKRIAWKLIGTDKNVHAQRYAMHGNIFRLFAFILHIHDWLPLKYRKVKYAK